MEVKEDARLLEIFYPHLLPFACRSAIEPRRTRITRKVQLVDLLARFRVFGVFRGKNDTSR
jgi:hypothetical protein